MLPRRTMRKCGSAAGRPGILCMRLLRPHSLRREAQGMGTRNDVQGARPGAAVTTYAMDGFLSRASGLMCRTAFGSRLTSIDLLAR